jgi:hypothetical protein
MGARGRKSKLELSAPVFAPVAARRRTGVVDPPRPLGEHGLALWQRVATEYDIDSSSALEQLVLACATLDRAEACAAQIAIDGLMLDGRENPLIKHELAARAFVARTLQRLGLEL